MSSHTPTSPVGVGIPFPFTLHSLMIADASISLVSKWYTNCSPSMLRGVAPSPLTFSVTRAPNICDGNATPVGWYWIVSAKASSAPTLYPNTSPSAVAP